MIHNLRTLAVKPLLNPCLVALPRISIQIFIVLIPLMQMFVCVNVCFYFLFHFSFISIFFFFFLSFPPSLCLSPYLHFFPSHLIVNLQCCATYDHNWYLSLFSHIINFSITTLHTGAKTGLKFCCAGHHSG